MVPAIPTDALEVVRSAFAAANQAVSTRLCRLPNLWETTLDQTFIDEIAGWGGPVLVESGWTVRIETHFLGGGRHWGPEWDYPPFRRWEIADIGVLVMIRNGDQLVRTKLGLFQSKRLYPVEQCLDEAEVHDYLVGFARLYEEDAFAADASQPRSFTFDGSSSYKMLLVGDQQVDVIRDFERKNKTPVHYMLYNPETLRRALSKRMRALIGHREIEATEQRKRADRLETERRRLLEPISMGLSRSTSYARSRPGSAGNSSTPRAGSTVSPPSGTPSKRT